MGITIGIDLGGTNVRAAVVDAAGGILAAHRAALTDRAPQAVAAAVARSAAEALRLAGVSSAAGAAVGVAGMVDRGSGVVLNAPNLGWRDVPFQSLLATALPCPVRICNDLSAAAYGEALAGAGRGAADVALVLVGTGVGSGLILGGRLHEGASGIAGELGHTKVRPGGRLCGCGELGCLEAYAGGANLARRAEESALGAALTAGELEEAAGAGNAAARELLADAGDLLGLACANLVTLLNPSVLILGGGVLQAAPTVKARLVAGVDALAGRNARRALSIRDAALGDDAGVLGAALLAR